MRFSELVASQKDFNLRKTDVLVIIPFYRNYEALFRHLDLLSRQTYRDFNAILVLNVVSDEKRIVEHILQKDFGFGIIVAKRKEDTGSSGGFFTGEKYALENGYGMVVLADDDCMPEDKDLLEQIVKRSSQVGAAAPKVRMRIDEKTWVEGGSPHMYSFYKTELLRRVGLHYVPLYIGADDTEFGRRVSKVIEIKHVERWASHPYIHSIFADFRRSILYRINHMLFGGLLLGLRWLLEYLQNFSVLCPAYMLFGTPVVREGGRYILSSVLSFRYGRPALEGFKGNVEMGKPPASAKRFSLKERPSIWNIFRKEALLEPLPNDAILLSMIFAKRTWIETKKGAYLMADNGNAALHLLKLLLFVGLVPLFAFAGLLSIPFGFLRKPNTMGYGLE